MTASVPPPTQEQAISEYRAARDYLQKASEANENASPEELARALEPYAEAYEKAIESLKQAGVPTKADGTPTNEALAKGDPKGTTDEQKKPETQPDRPFLTLLNDLAKKLLNPFAKDAGVATGKGDGAPQGDGEGKGTGDGKGSGEGRFKWFGGKTAPAIPETKGAVPGDGTKTGEGPAAGSGTEKPGAGTEKPGTPPAKTGTPPPAAPPAAPKPAPTGLAKVVEQEKAKPENKGDAQVPSPALCKDNATLCGFKFDNGNIVPLDSENGKKLALADEYCKGDEKCFADAVEHAKKVNGGTAVPPGYTPPNDPPNPPLGQQPPGGNNVPSGPSGAGNTPNGSGGDSPSGGGGSGLGNIGQMLQSALKALQPILPQLMEKLFGPKEKKPEEPKVPSVELSASPTTVNASSTSRLSWSGKNIASCTVLGPGSKKLTTGGASGAITTPELKRSTEFGIACSGTDGKSITSDVVTVRVNGDTEAPIPVIFPNGETSGAYGPAYSSGSQGTQGAQGTTGSNGTPNVGSPNEAPVTPQTSGHDAKGNQVSGWCDPNMPIDAFTQCLCNLEPNTCRPWKQ